jgi:CPA2 family monovalent cation:H+ antiporter-2
MQEHGTDLTGLALVVLAALVCGLAVRWVKQPSVVGYILAGVILGPSGLALVEGRASIEVLAELGVLLLLFIIGMELSLRAIQQVWKIALLTTLCQIAVALGAMAIFARVLDWPTPLTVVLGFAVALSSTALSVKMLEEISELRTRVGQITVGILLAQDLAVVPMMLIVDSYRTGGDSLGATVVIKVALSLTFLALLIFYLLRRKRLRLPFVADLSRKSDLVPVAGLVFCFGAAALTGLFGLSVAYGAFLAGLVIGNSTSRPVMIHSMKPIQNVLIMVFFLSIGLLLDLRHLWENLGTVLLIVAFIVVFKTALNVVLIRFFGESWPRALIAGALLAQIGEFSFVLAGLGLRAGALSGEYYRLIVAVTVLSLLASPFWLEMARRLRRIRLLGVTSGRETLRLVLGREGEFVRGSTLRAEHLVVTTAKSAKRWVSDVRAGEPKDSPPEEPQPKPQPKP